MLNGEVLDENILHGEIQREVIGIGAEGGTTNYNDLSNKPMINGIELQGNKTTEELGIVSEESDPTVPSYVKNIKESDIESWNNKVEQSQVESINNSIADIEENKASVDYVDTQVDEVREVAEGKTKSFTIATLSALGTLLGIDTSVVADEYTITNTTITYKEQSIELKQGDLFLIVDTSVPDYWVSVDDMKIYKMETTKVDLSDYAKVEVLNNYMLKPTKDPGGYLVVPRVDHNGDEGQIRIAYQPLQYALVAYTSGGVINVNAPNADLNATNKKYVDDIAKTIPVMTATQLEDGSYSLSINTEV